MVSAFEDSQGHRPPPLRTLLTLAPLIRTLVVSRRILLLQLYEVEKMIIRHSVPRQCEPQLLRVGFRLDDI